MEPIEVRVRDCACPETPHEGDVVYLAPTLSAEGGIAAEQDMGRSYPDQDSLTRQLLLTFTRYGAKGWNLVDESGPVPFSIDDLLADWALARPVAIRAGELYLASVTGPLASEQPKRSPTGRTRATTSRRQQPTQTSSESP